MSDIMSAEDALARSNSYDLSEAQIIATIAHSIDSGSANGKTKVTHSFSKQAVSPAELDRVQQTFRAKGYEVSTMPNGDDATFLFVSWAPPK